MMPVMDSFETISQIAKKGCIKDVTIEIITDKWTKDNQKLSQLGSYIWLSYKAIKHRSAIKKYWVM